MVGEGYLYTHRMKFCPQQRQSAEEKTINSEGAAVSVSVPASREAIDEEILHAQQAICEAIERRFKELIPHELEHYACKQASRTLRRTIDQLMSLPPRDERDSG